MYCNFHKHTMMSNISSLDCISKPEEYMKRASELGHTEYFTTEHGYQGNIFDVYTLCQKYNLKCVYGVEAYYVDNRHEKDKGNYHIILIAMTENGRKQINKIISEANISGFYYKARIDNELLLTLNPKDVVITTACIQSRLFKGDNWLENFFLPVYNHFGKSLYLEVQNHNSAPQIEHNKKILELSEKYGVKIIYDAAHAFGVFNRVEPASSAEQKSVGCCGDMSMFSFHPTKLFHSCEGGLLVFRDANVQKKLFELRNFAIHGELFCTYICAK